MRLVSVPRVDAPALQRVALWRVEAELAGYVERRLRTRWPRLEVLRIAHAPTADADLVICGEEPRAPVRAPTLWLGDVDRGSGLVRLGAQLWRCALPITGRQLVRAVEAIR